MVSLISDAHLLPSKAFLWMLGSDIFKPSAYDSRPQVVPGGLAFDASQFLGEKSALEKTDLFLRELKDWKHTVAKPFSMLARVVYIMAISSLLSPLAATRNLVWMAANSSAFFKNSYDSDYRIEKFKEYAHSFLRDLIPLSLASGLFFKPKAPPSNSNALIFWVYNHRIIVLSLLFSVLGLVNELAVSIFVPRQEQANAMMAVLLKNHFGLVGEKGELLRILGIDNKKGEKFFQIREETAQRALHYINMLQSRLSDNQQIPFEYPPTQKQIANHLAKISENVGPVEKELFDVILKLLSDFEELTTLVEKIRMVTERDLLMEAYTKEIPVHYQLPFPCSFLTAKQFFLKTGSELVLRQKQAEQTPTNFSVIAVPLNASDLDKRYLAKRNKLIREEFPFGVLGVTRANSIAEIEKALRRIRLCVHPDKVSETYRVDATAIFDYLSKARDQAIFIKLNR